MSTRWILLALSAVVAAGCASGATPEAMVAVPRLEPARSARTVSVETCGGRPTFPLGSSKISNRDLRDAVARSLAASGLLHPVYDRVGDFHLEVCIEELDQPNWAFPMTVRLVTDWRLTPKDETAPLWEERLVESYTEPFATEFFGIRRLRYATEGAARGSIAAALARMAERLP